MSDVSKPTAPVACRWVDNTGDYVYSTIVYQDAEPLYAKPDSLEIEKLNEIWAAMPAHLNNEPFVKNLFKTAVDALSRRLQID